jgi:hypothetical protein
MQPSTTDKAQISFLLPDLERQLDPRNALFRLARAIDWRVFEKEFRPLYCTDGRPGLAIRRLVGLLMHKAFSSELPLDNPLPEKVVFSGNEFVPTGRFAFGTRQKVFEAISSLNGIPKDGFPAQSTRYLVIGVFASRDWYHTNYGRKIERAVELRAEGHPITILSEEHWRSFLI